MVTAAAVDGINCKVRSVVVKVAVAAVHQNGATLPRACGDSDGMGAFFQPLSRLRHISFHIEFCQIMY